MLILLVRTLLIWSIFKPYFCEPVCSKFAYEEQLLEKMVRMEFNVGQSEKEIKITNERVQESLQQLSSNWNKVIEENKAIKIETKNVIEESITMISAQIEEMKKEKKRMNDEIDKKLNENKNLLLVPNIAFKARLPSQLDPPDDKVIVFTKTLVNDGDGYNNGTGIFTAPIGGTYLFQCQLCLEDRKWITFGIFIENTLHAVGRFYEKDFSVCFSIETTSAMSAGQKASVKSWASADGTMLMESDIHRWNVFSGTLIHK